MPEGPEVKKIVDQLNAEVLDQDILEFDILAGRYQKHGPPEGTQDFLKSLPVKIKKIDCKGKFIYFILENQKQEYLSVWNTLGMSGGWSLKEEKHSRIKFKLSGKNLYFNDMRNFGTMHFLCGKDAIHKTQDKLDTLGPDLLKETLSDYEFKNRLIFFAKDKTLPEALMDQKIFAGVGNYLKAEALYLSKISPLRKVESLSDDEFLELNKAVTSLIRESYKSGGSTFKVYQDLYGQVGNFSSRFLVYGRKQDPLGNPVKTIETKDGRKTHWVPGIQK